MSSGLRGVSVEGPEAAILAGQMRDTLVGRTVSAVHLRDSVRLQAMGFMNRDASDYGSLIGGVVESASARGNTIVLKLDNGFNLVISPEYGGEIFFHEREGSVSEVYHLRVDFADGSCLTVRLTSMGGVTSTCDSGLGYHYLYVRDFDPEVLDPLGPSAEGFTFERLDAALQQARRAMKSVLVGKDAVLVGVSNSTFQDILFRAGIHPKRRAVDLSPSERWALYDAIRFVMGERVRLGGKGQWRDLHGRWGDYAPAMGPGMGGRACPTCGETIQRLALGGGEVNICPRCQR